MQISTRLPSLGKWLRLMTLFIATAAIAPMIGYGTNPAPVSESGKMKADRDATNDAPEEPEQVEGLGSSFDWASNIEGESGAVRTGDLIQPALGSSINEEVALAIAPNEPGLGSGRVRLFIEKTGVNLASREHLEFFGIPQMAILEKSDFESYSELEIVQAGGDKLRFRLPSTKESGEDQIQGKPIGESSHSSARLSYVDSAFAWCEKSQAKYIRQSMPGIGVVDYPLAGGNAVRFETKQGRVYNFPMASVEIIRQRADGALVVNGTYGDGLIRQVKTPAGLIDVVSLGERSYEIKKYGPEQIGAKVSGLYTANTAPHFSIKVEAPENTQDVLVITKVESPLSSVTRHTITMSGLSELWKQEIAVGDFAYTRNLTRTLAPELGNGYRRSKWSAELISAPAGVTIYGGTSVYGLETISFQKAMVSSIQTLADGKVLSRARSANAPGWAPGSIGRSASQQRASNTRVNYSYEGSSGRMTGRLSNYSPETGWPFSSVEEVYNYAPLKAGESVDFGDFRPRTKTIKVGGVSIGKWFFSAQKNNGAYTELHELAQDPSKELGDSTNLRQVAEWYGPGEHLGRLKKEVQVDGSVTLYEYVSLPGDALEVTILANLDVSANPVAETSVKTREIRDARAWPIETTRMNWNGAQWIVQETIRRTYNVAGRLTREEREDGATGQRQDLLLQEWNGPLLVRQVDAAGVATTFEYFVGSTLIKKASRAAVAASEGNAGQPAIVTTYAGSVTLNERQVPEWKNRVATVLKDDVSLTEQETLDEKGQVVSRVNAKGVTLTQSYLLEAPLASPSLSYKTASSSSITPDDLDGDGLPDIWEIQWFGRVDSQTGSQDADGDKVTTRDEYLHGTNPLSALDTDPNGLPDDWETVHLGYHVLWSAEEDPDGDKVTNFREWELDTKPENDKDSDRDDLPDDWERSWFRTPSLTDQETLAAQSRQGDPDDDKLTNREEWTKGTNPTVSAKDSNSDGVSDDPRFDSDKDSLPDDWEIFWFGGIGVQSGAGDFDQDGISNRDEWIKGLDPVVSGVDANNDGFPDDSRFDSDQDGLPDDWERFWFANPALTDQQILAAQSGGGDADSDKIQNADEFTRGTSPKSETPNGTTVPEDWKAFYFPDPASQSNSDDPDGDKVTNLEEWKKGTNPTSGGDSDNDSLPDDWERYRFGDSTLTDQQTLAAQAGGSDADGDKVSNRTEWEKGTNPTISGIDSDNDGFPDDPRFDSDQDDLPDDWEICYFGNFYALADGHSDEDGADNLAEWVANTHPRIGVDVDNDGLPDDWESLWFGDTAQQSGEDDLDNDQNGNPVGDHVSNADEWFWGTSPNSTADEDQDDLPDDWEKFWFKSITIQSGSGDADGDGVSNLDEWEKKSNPLSKIDLDNDGLPDDWETFWFQSSSAQTGSNDPDGDKVTNLREWKLGLDPTTSVDSDRDNLPDDWERSWFGTDLTVQDGDGLKGDQDGDKVSNANEWSKGTNPVLKVDSDYDYLPDDWEIFRFGSLSAQNGSGDPDGDKVNNAGEWAKGTDPSVSGVDSDQDGLPDDSRFDSDGDGLPEDWEIFWFGSPTVQSGEDDKDGDKVTNRIEWEQDTNPTVSGDDTNNDGVPDDPGFDSDHDGLPDDWEVLWFGGIGTQSGYGDFDGDKITNREEWAKGTNPQSGVSSDGDNLPDDWEEFWFGDLSRSDSTDSDLDGIIDLREFINNTRPITTEDSDTDGVDDDLERDNFGNDLSFFGDISVGYEYGLMVRSDRKVYAWGQQGDGRLGNGAIAMGVVAPTEVPFAQFMAKQVSSGAKHSLILDRSGNVWGFGANALGQVGNNQDGNKSTQAISSAVQVVKSAAAAPDYLTNCTKVGAGPDFSLALSNGNVYAWGTAANGRLGDGNVAGYRAYAGMVTSAVDPYPELTGIESIAAGNGFAFAVDKDGQVWAWGMNKYGQLGNGDTKFQSQSRAVLVVSKALVTNAPAEPLKDVVGVSAGFAHAAFIRRSEEGTAQISGEVWCAGSQSDGRLGNGVLSAANKPVPVPVVKADGSRLTKITQVSAGPRHTLALDESGRVWSWGCNKSGELGDGSVVSRASAATVKISDTANPGQLVDLEDIVRVAAGGGADQQGCSYAIARDGTIYTWGENSKKQLGFDAAVAAIDVLNPTEAPLLKANRPPSITLTAAEQTESGTSVPTGKLLLLASALDKDRKDGFGDLARVDFFANGVFLDSDAVKPYVLEWDNAIAGTYGVVAVAYDKGGLFAVSDPLSLQFPIAAGSQPGPQKPDRDSDGIPDDEDADPWVNAGLTDPDGSGVPKTDSAGLSILSDADLIGRWDFEAVDAKTGALVSTPVTTGAAIFDPLKAAKWDDKTWDTKKKKWVGGSLTGTGMPSRCLNLNTDGAYVALPTAAFSGKKDQSWSMWIKVDPTKAGERTWFSIGDAGKNPRLHAYFDFGAKDAVNNTTLWLKTYWDAGKVTNTTKEICHWNLAFPLDDGNWHHLALQWVTSTSGSDGFKLWVDGQVKEGDFPSTDLPPVVLSTGSVWLGKFTNAKSTTYGTLGARVDRLRVYGGTQAVAELYKQDIDRDRLWDITEARNYHWEDKNNNGRRDVGDASSPDPFFWEYPFGDRDHDGLSDSYEQEPHVYPGRYGGNPIYTDLFEADTDNDGIPDGWELAHHLNPTDGTDGGIDTDIDTDQDGIPDLVETNAGADPSADQSANTAGRSNYLYDAMGRLIEADDATYTFDIEGNLESSSN
jgi:alpha-tubulin suppressor-like RCC1 family protein